MIRAQERKASRWLGIVGLASRNLRQRWLESLFIVLGIALGVGVFTGVESYIRYSYTVTSETLRLSPEVHSVQVAPRRFDANSLYTSGAPALRIGIDQLSPVQLDAADIVALREEVPSVGSVFVRSGISGSQVTAIDGRSVGSGGSTDQRIQLSIEAVTPDQLLYGDRRFLAGAAFTWDDVKHGAHHLVLDSDQAAILFPELTPEEIVGRTVTRRSGPSGIIWTIVGIAEPLDIQPRPMGSIFGGDLTAVSAYAPIGTGDSLLAGAFYREVYVQPVTGVSNEELIRDLQAYVDQVYAAGSVEVREPNLGTAGVGSYVSVLILAGLALFIAAISILNLSTARVLRRQRFTGMSIALGATRPMLFWQTAGEALLLGVAGSLVGLAVAKGLVRLIHSYLLMRASQGVPPDRDPYAGLAVGWVDASIGLALGTLISLLFGLYPAWLASRQQPAEALRNE